MEESEGPSGICRDARTDYLGWMPPSELDTFAQSSVHRS